MIKSFLKAAYDAVPGKPLLFRITRKYTRLSENAYRHLHFKGPFEVQLPTGGRFIMMHFGNQVENDLFWVGYGNGWERTSLRIWAAMANNARTVFDIGANTGTFALAAKAVQPMAHVEAFEPVARVFSRLSVNAALNGSNIKVNCIALSDHTGFATLFDNGDDHVYSASLNRAMLGAQGDRAKTVVPVQTVDDYCSDNDIMDIDLVKIDTEMHEPEVLAGAQKLLSHNRPAILIEILNLEVGNRVARLMIGYRFFEVLEGQGMVPSDQPGASGARNYLALPADDPRCAIIGDALGEDQVYRLA